MTTHHRAVGWGRSTAESVPEPIRSLYTLDLLGVGAPAEVLSLACRASLDEVRHAELFAGLAGVYSGHDESPPPASLPCPRTPDHRAAVGVVEARRTGVSTTRPLVFTGRGGPAGICWASP